VSRALVWFRGKDLRLADHAPLADVVASGSLPIPLFVLDPYFFAPERARELPNRIQFLLGSLRELERRIAELGSRLLIVAGRSVDVVPRLAERLAVDRIVAQRWTEPFARERDRRIAAASRVPFQLFEGETLAPPDALRTGEGRPYSVYTPFQRAFRAQIDVDRPLAVPKSLPALPEDVLAAVAPEQAAIPSLNELGLQENPRLVEPGETAARRRLKAFLDGDGPNYDTERDRLDLAATSRLSQDLKFGTLSPRTVWRAVHVAFAEHPPALQTFANELLWREFNHALLFADPELLRLPFHRKFVGFPWLSESPDWQAWVTGHTGYPVVDAAARQLLEEGFVHNRARMITASFLTKHLLLHYQLGEAHYMKYLVDGDWANNNAGWQWSAGCGADGQPYFRVFNPTTQSEKFDPEGAYIRRYLPELANVPNKYIHAPSEAPPNVLSGAGLRLGPDYPTPIVEHGFARKRFLAIAESYLAKRKTERVGA
jgi:deoxyribodipyrimidine photo-lyase